MLMVAMALASEASWIRTEGMGQEKEIRYESALSLPKTAKPAEGYPLIVYMHGSGGGDEKNWPNTRQFDGPMGQMGRDAEFPFAILMLRSPGGWQPTAVLAAIDETLAKGGLDENRVILTGFSMGAMGTWRVAYADPKRFAAIVPVGGRSGEAPKMPLIKHIPAWVFNGEKDDATTAESARQAVADLKTAGGNVKYTEYPGASHVESLQKAYAEGELYAWMLAQRRR